MIKVLLTFLLVGFVSLVSSCGTGAEQVSSRSKTPVQVSSKSQTPIQGGANQQVISADAPDDADTLITNDGKVYKSVKIKEINPAGIKIIHSSGASGIPYEKLSKKLQNELGGFNPKEAEKHRRKINSQQAKIADVFEARQIQNDKLEREREAEEKRSYEAKLARYRKAKLEYDPFASKNLRLGKNKARTRRSSAESTDSLIARLAAQQRVKTIEQERLQEQLRRAGDALKVDNGDLDRRLKRMELDNQLREQDELARQLHDSLKNQ